MAIPKFDKYMYPILKFAYEENKDIQKKEYFGYCKKFFNFSDEDLDVMTSTGYPLARNRMGWALAYLKKSKLLISYSRGFYKITDLGISFLNKYKDKLSEKILKDELPELKRWATEGNKNKKTKKTIDFEDLNINSLTPDDQIDTAISILNKNLVDELLEKVREMDPFLFEKLVVDLLLKMGYGGSQEDIKAGIVTDKTNDKGIDGIIKEDRLGLEKIYIQAKRYNENNVIGRPDLQKFVGAYQGKTSKGVFITTSGFNKNANEYSKAIPQLILINGEELAELMIEYNIGLGIEKTIFIKKIDTDYFDE